MRNIVITAVLACVGISASLLAQTGSTATAPKAGTTAEAVRYRAFLDKYCIACHSNRAANPVEGPVNLQSASFDELLAHAETWERVLRKLSVRAMPPPGLPRPSEAEYAGFTSWLAASLDRAWEGHSTPGRYVVHRLNRAEYANAIRDLLAVDIDVTDLLPTDGAEFGFDNIATALKTSPLLLEGYVNAAERVSAMAVGDPQVKPGTTEHSISREFSQNGYIEGLPLGTVGGTVVRHVFPADAEYKLSGRLVRGVQEGYAGVEGNDTPYIFVITVDGAEVYSAPIGGPKDDEIQAADLAAAQPIIDKRMTGRVRVTAGPHDVGFTWRERPAKLQDVWEPSPRDSQEVHMVAGMPRLRTVSIDGPYNVHGLSEGPSRQRLFVCHPGSSGAVNRVAAKGASGASPDETTCAAKILTNLARHAYRRPVTSGDIEAPMSFYKRARQQEAGKPGGSFDDGIRAGVARVLSSPYFLYRIESDPPGARAGVAHPVSDVELASRLSFFLWSSNPDEKLLDLAAAGRLREPEVLTAQVHRMLSDDRSDALVNNFTGQWLQLRNLEAKVVPDILMFPDFDDNMRKAFRTETQMFFGYILRQDRSTLDLLSADYTFADERLARHYGIKGVYGPQFRRVKLTDPNRRGLLGQGSILSMTSVATRTSPVYRGKYVLTTFLNTPPPPAPPNVPTLDESNKDSKIPKTVRAQLELHRTNQPCAGCHRVIDPPGFALENFDSVGQWRDKGADGAPLDVAGTLADGQQVNGPVALREAILSRPEAFVTVVTEKMLTYALGRGLEPSDMPVVRRIVKKAAQNDYRLSSVVLGIVESAPFQMRTKLEPAETGSADTTKVAQSNITSSNTARPNKE